MIELEEGRMCDHLGELVRGPVEVTRHALLCAGAEAVGQTQHHERNPERADFRAGSRDRRLTTKAGEVTLKMPKLRRQPKRMK